MRRDYYEFLCKHYYGLILDCLHYCWQQCEITDDEYTNCYRSLDMRKIVEGKDCKL